MKLSFIFKDLDGNQGRLQIDDDLLQVEFLPKTNTQTDNLQAAIKRDRFHLIVAYYAPELEQYISYDDWIRPNNTLEKLQTYLQQFKLQGYGIFFKFKQPVNSKLIEMIFNKASSTILSEFLSEQFRRDLLNFCKNETDLLKYPPKTTSIDFNQFKKNGWVNVKQMDAYFKQLEEAEINKIYQQRAEFISAPTSVIATQETIFIDGANNDDALENQARALIEKQKTIQNKLEEIKTELNDAKNKLSKQEIVAVKGDTSTQKIFDTLNTGSQQWEAILTKEKNWIEALKEQNNNISSFEDSNDDDTGKLQLENIALNEPGFALLLENIFLKQQQLIYCPLIQQIEMIKQTKEVLPEPLGNYLDDIYFVERDQYIQDKKYATLITKQALERAEAMEKKFAEEQTIPFHHKSASLLKWFSELWLRPLSNAQKNEISSPADPKNTEVIAARKLSF